MDRTSARSTSWWKRRSSLRPPPTLKSSARSTTASAVCTVITDNSLSTALNYQLKALSLHEKLPESVVLVQSLNAVGVTYQAMGDHRRARTYLKRALDSAVTASSARVQDFIRANLVSSLIEQEAYEESARVLEGTHPVRSRNTYPQLRYSQLSEVYRLMGRYDAALDASHKAVAICAERDDAICFAALDERAEAHLARGNRAAALGGTNAGATMLERIRARAMRPIFRGRISAPRCSPGTAAPSRCSWPMAWYGTHWKPPSSPVPAPSLIRRPAVTW